MLAHEAHDVGIVQVVALEEGDGGLRGLNLLGGMHHLHLSARLLHLDVLADDHLWTEVEHQSHDEAQPHLPDNLELAVQPLLVALEYLDVVVGKAQRAQPHGGDEHQHHIYIAQSPQQQAGDEYRHDDDDPAHAWHAHLLHAEGVYLGIALRLGNLFALQQVDEPVAPDARDEQRQYHRHQRAERGVGKHSRPGEVVLVKPLE